MHNHFFIQAWEVWPPIISDENIHLLQQRRLSCVPKMLKRRLTPLAKTVFCAALPCVNQETPLPIVFSSAHGELTKSLQMMEMIERGEEISPTTFSLSVHNAIAGLFSIALTNKKQITVLAPGEEGIAAAFIEALGLFLDGEPEVLIVFYDEPLPDFFPTQPFHLTTDNRLAVALRVARQGSGQQISFFKDTPISAYKGEQALQLPLLIDFLARPSHLHITTPTHSWHWQKHV